MMKRRNDVRGVVFTILVMLGLVAGNRVRGAETAEFSKPIIDIGIVAKDLEKAARFYTNALGCKEVTGFAVPAEMATRIGLVHNQPVKVRVFAMGEGDLATRIKLMSFPDAPGKPADQAYIHSTYGIRYLTLYVTSADRALERLKAAGVKTLGETPMAMGKNQIIAVRDPDGNFIELIGP